MRDTIHLEPAQVPLHLRLGYNGKKFKAIVCEEMSIPIDAGLWSGGSRETYTILRLSDGATIEPVNHNASPFGGTRKEKMIKLEPDFVVVEHSMFCGTDVGLTFYVHPQNAMTAVVGPSVELSVPEKMVLDATKRFKSSYNGKDRYQMSMDEMGWGSKEQADHPSREEWNFAKKTLIDKGLLDKRGAITTKGRNWKE